MRKFFTSFAFILAFGAYGVYQYFANTSQASVNSPAPASSGSASAITTVPISQVPTAPVPASVRGTATGAYADGTYTGSVADAYYGNIQVKAVIANGKIADVVFLQYPNDRDDSRYINGQAMPILKKEAISAQSATVSTVSGASDTSSAFRQSLSAALAKAQA